MHLVVGAAVLPSDAWVIVGGGQLQLHVSPVIMDPRREQVTFQDGLCYKTGLGGKSEALHSSSVYGTVRLHGTNRASSWITGMNSGHCSFHR